MRGYSFFAEGGEPMAEEARNRETANEDVAKEDVDAVLEMLENFGKSEESRFKIVMSDEIEQGKSEKQYHLGRCDVGSPWAKGQAFDVLPDEAQKGNTCG